MKPVIPLTDPRFAYTPSYRTNIRELFDRIRTAQSQPANVRALKREAKRGT